MLCMFVYMFICDVCRYVCLLCMYVCMYLLRRYLCMSSRSFAGTVGNVTFSVPKYSNLYEILSEFA